MSTDKIYVCTLCNKTWPELPEGSVRLQHSKRGGNGHSFTYRLADGSIHIIKTVQSTKEQ